MGNKIMVVTYNSMEGIPLGRHEKGRVIVYSGDYGRAKYSGIPFVGPDQIAEAEAKMNELKQDLAVDARNIDEAYIYVGAAAMQGAMELIRDLLKIGKKVFMIACDCDRDAKIRFANNLGIDVIWADCGGENECALIFNQHSTAV